MEAGNYYSKTSKRNNLSKFPIRGEKKAFPNFQSTEQWQWCVDSCFYIWICSLRSYECSSELCGYNLNIIVLTLNSKIKILNKKNKIKMKSYVDILNKTLIMRHIPNTNTRYICNNNIKRLATTFASTGRRYWFFEKCWLSFGL